LDADWGGDLDESRSTFEYVFIVGEEAISWCIKKKFYKALLTMKVEHFTCCLATQEAIWLRSFFRISISLIELMIL